MKYTALEGKEIPLTHQFNGAHTYTVEKVRKSINGKKYHLTLRKSELGVINLVMPSEQFDVLFKNCTSKKQRKEQ